jgi:hypothetical protein
MTYGHSIAASAESRVASRARAAAGWNGFRAWRQLDADRRLQLVEQALRTSDGLIDEFSIAL